MALNYDKIRVLWIEDQPEAGEQSENLEEYDDLFEIINYANASAVGSIEKYEEFLFHHLTEIDVNDTKQASLFPVEIVSVDYDLSKNAPDSNTVGLKNWKLGTDISFIRSSSQSEKHQGKSSEFDVSRPQEMNYDDYDGCIINMLYLSEFFTHPCGSVITTYQDPKGRHRCAKVFEKHLERRHQIDLSYSGVRTWESILEAGVKALRHRIEQLYETRDIIISPSDLMALTEVTDHQVLTIRSPHALRQLPVNGLFIDVLQDERGNAIREWAIGLLESKVTRKSYITATKATDEIWSTYNNNVLMEEHAKFSIFHETNQFNEDYDRLKTTFGLKKTARGQSTATWECTANCIDIKSLNVSCTRKDEKSVRRWAALFLIRRLLKRILLFMEEANMTSVTRDGKQNTQSLFPTFEEDDILLLLYPVPKSPFPLPWHIGNSDLRNEKKDAWQKWMNNNLRFTPKDILTGSALTAGERQILQGIVMDEDVEFGHNPEMRLERWKSYEPARLFLFGTDMNSGSIKDE